MADLVRAVPMSSIAHPLVDQVGESGGRSWSLTETRSRVVVLDAWRLDLLERATRAGREVVLATDESSALTPALAQVWGEAGAHWLVRDADGGLRDGFSGRPLRQVGDLWATPATPGDGAAMAVRHLSGTRTDALELSAVVSVRLPPRSSSLLGGPVADLAAAVGTTPTAWGASEPVLRAWDPGELTAAVRARMPEPVQLVVRGPRLAALIRVRRTRHGVEETTHATMAAVGGDSDLAVEAEARSLVALARIAGTSVPLVGLVLARDARQDLLRRPFLRPLAVPVALLVGPPGVMTLRLDAAAQAERHGSEAVGRAKLPGLLYRLPGRTADPGAGWRALEDVLDGFDPASRSEALGAAFAPLHEARPPADDGDADAQP